MATKKQKRLAAAEKRQRYMEEIARTGLRAQQRDQQHRKQVAEDKAKKNLASDS